MRYDPVAITLHWLLAVLIITMLIMGFVMDDLPVSAKFVVYNLHKSIGITIIGLSVFRLIWRLLNPPPPLPEAMPRSQRFLAETAHWMLYAFMILMPLSGWLLISANPKFPVVFFGLGHAPFLPMPPLADPRATAHMLGGVHYFLGLAGAGLIVLHVAAALQHHFIKRDGILHRMLPSVTR